MCSSYSLVLGAENFHAESHHPRLESQDIVLIHNPGRQHTRKKLEKEIHGKKETKAKQTTKYKSQKGAASEHGCQKNEEKVAMDMDGAEETSGEARVNLGLTGDGRSSFNQSNLRAKLDPKKTQRN